MKKKKNEDEGEETKDNRKIQKRQKKTYERKRVRR